MKTFTQNYITKLIILAAVCFMPFISFGQNQDSSVAVSLFPNSPGAHEEVTITLSTFSFDLNRASITWKVDGTTTSQGIGQNTFIVRAGALGSTTTVDIDILISTGRLITKQIVISPADLDLLWEAIDSYVPPFYRGKALPASETQIKVVAIPVMRTGSIQVNPSSMVYNWKKNFQNIKNSSGFGKNSFTFRNGYLDDIESVSVEVSSLNQSTTNSDQVKIQIRTPKILFSEDDILEGTNYTYELQRGFTPRTTQTTIVAEPLFFSSKNATSPDFSYSWELNDESTRTPALKNVLSLQFDPNTRGTAEVSLDIKSRSRLFQSDTSLFTMFLNR